MTCSDVEPSEGRVRARWGDLAYLVMVPVLAPLIVIGWGLMQWDRVGEWWDRRRR